MRGCSAGNAARTPGVGSGLRVWGVPAGGKVLLTTEHPVWLGPGLSGTAPGGPAGSPSPPAPGSAPAALRPPPRTARDRLRAAGT